MIQFAWTMSKIIAKSPLRYPGGKTKLIKEISRLAPISYKEYREPFLGGGSYLLHVCQTQPTTVIKKASDKFYLLCNFWQHVQCCPDALIDEINKQKIECKVGPKLYITSANILKKQDNTDILKKAAAYFIQNRITFSGLGLAGGYSQASYDGRFKDNHIQNIKNVSKVLSNAQIICDSYEELLLKQDGEDVFIFLDAPYDIKSDNLYGDRGSMHKGFDHVKFAEDCKLSKHKLLITYNDNEKIRELFKESDGFVINEVTVGYSMGDGKNKKKIELFITKNY